MSVFYIILFVLLVLFSAFFSSAKTSLLSLNKIRLNLRAKKKEKKAMMLTKILKDPEEFFSTILIGNNFVNIAAASISALLFSRWVANEELSLLASTVVTTIIILFFAEIIPKSYAFRHNEKISNIYAYPIKFFTYLFYPFVKVTTFFSRLLFKTKEPHVEEKGLSIEEIKHFLSSQQSLVRYNPESLRMVNEIINITEKDIKSIMTPRLNVIALDESAGIDELKKILLEKKITKVPVYRETLDNITGIIHSNDMLSHLLNNPDSQLDLKTLQRTPIFLSEFSALKYALKQFKKHRLNIAVIIDEYGATIGILTLNDIFSEILGEIEIGKTSITTIKPNIFKVKGDIPVDEVNDELHLDLPEKVEYTTMSGLFIYHFGKFPKEKSKVMINDLYLVVKRMGERKIEELMLIKGEK
ncbi:MAG: HlyC/CorC family transporter [bacterium]|nr:HlyC/CorC family transporter [bacterium]